MSIVRNAIAGWAPRRRSRRRRRLCGCPPPARPRATPRRHGDRGRPRTSGVDVRDARARGTAARPSPKASSPVSSDPASPRTPSVPNKRAISREGYSTPRKPYARSGRTCEHARMSKEGPVQVYASADTTDGLLMQGRLETKGIPVMLKGESEGPYRMGPTYLWVAAEHEVDARAIVEAVRAAPTPWPTMPTSRGSRPRTRTRPRAEQPAAHDRSPPVRLRSLMRSTPL